MTHFLLALLAIAMAASVLSLKVPHSSAQATHAAVQLEAYRGFAALEEALTKYQAANGAPLPVSKTWLATLTPTYGFSPPPLPGTQWVYGEADGNRYVCLAPGAGSGLTEAQYFAMRRLKAPDSDVELAISTRGCGATASDAAPAAYPALAYATYWLPSTTSANNTDNGPSGLNNSEDEGARGRSDAHRAEATPPSERISRGEAKRKMLRDFNRNAAR